MYMLYIIADMLNIVMRKFEQYSGKYDKKKLCFKDVRRHTLHCG